MSGNLDEFCQLLKRLSELDYVHSEDIPNIDLYMDQVTTFMEEHLKTSKRHNDDKVLTKTMINNYAKNDLLPPPIKKKYSKEHMILLTFIYYFKSFLSISDIQSLLEFLSKNYFSQPGQDRTGQLNLDDIYKEIVSMEKEQLSNLTRDVKNKFTAASKTFKDSQLPPEELQNLQRFAFVCLLSFDVYIKKQMIEMMVDNTNEAKQKPKKNHSDSSEQAG